VAWTRCDGWREADQDRRTGAFGLPRSPPRLAPAERLETRKNCSTRVPRNRFSACVVFGSAVIAWVGLHSGDRVSLSAPRVASRMLREDGAGEPEGGVVIAVNGAIMRPILTF